MRCYNCESEIEDAEICPICKKAQYMDDMFGERILISDYLQPLEKPKNDDIVSQEEK